MELDFFEIIIDGRTHPVPKQEFTPYEKSLGKSGFKITVWDSNIEAVKKVIATYQIQHLQISTSDLEFLKEPVFKNLKGISINGAFENLRPIERLTRLEYLELLNERKGKIDFNYLKNLKLLHCNYSKVYKFRRPYKARKFVFSGLCRTSFEGI